jgi:hypothetical protein
MHQAEEPDSTPLGEPVLRVLAFEPERAALRLDELLREMQEEIRCLSRGNIDVELTGSVSQPSPVIAMSRDEAQDLIRHLVIDASDAMPGGGTLSLGVSEVAVGNHSPSVPPELASGRYVALVVRDRRHEESGADSGYFSTVEKGRALGLCAAFAAIANRGCLSVSREGDETVVRIYFPCGTEVASRQN